ncbi:hypothetical protein CEXT_407941 [Caerostris extrusa]|uniref:Uncharacterized protein n=1 Tax=Caerostris extrusa TaxID=172846 RepID=A0AAV4PGG5_CAEEX|nr:hypothetical protein CEXT_407941 [Caerostris extrusa]
MVFLRSRLISSSSILEYFVVQDHSSITILHPYRKLRPSSLQWMGCRLVTCLVGALQPLLGKSVDSLLQEYIPKMKGDCIFVSHLLDFSQKLTSCHLWQSM